MKRKGRRVPRFRLRIVVALVLMMVAVIAAVLVRPQGGCAGRARCFTGTVERIIDGDTLDIGGERIRLALVDTPERNETGYAEATSFTASLCPVGSSALVDEDDGQTAGSYGRMLAKVTCGGKVLNAELVASGHAIVLTHFCGASEFAAEPWTDC